MTLTVVQVLPALDAGGVERGTVEIAGALVAHGHRSIVVSGGGRLQRELTGAGSEHITMPVGVKSPLALRLVPRLRTVLRELRADIVHARSRLPAWITYLAWRGMDTRARPGFVTSVHGPYSVNPYSAIMTRGQRVIAISGFIHDYILGNYPGADPARIITIPRGVDRACYPHGFTPDQAWRENWHREFPRLQGCYLITLPARITPWKGQQDFIGIIAALVNSGLEVHGLIAGGAGSARTAFLAQLKTEVARQGLAPHVTFTGDRADLREIMSSSALVLSLAREPEAFGRTALEALALGVPVIAYDHGGAAEVLRAMFPEGLIKPGDCGAVTALIRRFHAHPPRVADTNPFPLQHMIDATLEVYRELSENRGQGL